MLDPLTAPPEAVGLEDIETARQRLDGLVVRTPLVFSGSLAETAGRPVYLKLEHLQNTGSFKLRGAANALKSLNDEERSRGVVTVSTGNHGNAVAFAARSLGIRAIVCMSKLVPHNKVENVRSNGAEVRLVGRSQDDAQVEADRLVAEEGLTLVPPFDHPAVVAGQGTIGIEIADDLPPGPDAPVIVVPLSGGGLISGVACAVKARLPDARVVGVTMERGAAMVESLRAGHPVAVEEVPSLADSLGGGIGLGNRYTFDMVRALVDDVVLVGEDPIADAIRHAYRHERQVIEGAAAVGIAALLAGRVPGHGPVVLVLSGANIDMDLHRRLINGASAGEVLGGGE